MKIYAIRDRMLAYFRQPFLAPNDNEVQAAISVQLIRGDQLDWKTAPHHFELWSLGGVDQEEGTIEVGQRLICGLDALIRTGVREDPDTESREGATGTPAGGRQSSPEVSTAPGHAQAGDLPQQAPTAPLKGKASRPGPGRRNKVSKN